MKKFIMILVITLLSVGCSTYQGVAEQYAVDGARSAADAADFQLRAAVWSICVAPSLGSIRRAFPEEEKLHAYLNACILLENNVRTD